MHTYINTCIHAYNWFIASYTQDCLKTNLGKGVLRDKGKEVAKLGGEVRRAQKKRMKVMLAELAEKMPKIPAHTKAQLEETAPRQLGFLRVGSEVSAVFCTIVGVVSLLGAVIGTGKAIYKMFSGPTNDETEKTKLWLENLQEHAENIEATISGLVEKYKLDKDKLYRKGFGCV